ncbi:two-component system response regulator [Nitrospira lenta]|uniref:Sensory response regulator with diguanylate cyclase domain n=1 Tax=Nitrospira lenta TaxID=1436998 RepID=A0A330L2L1_9BACT|nr:EAL domain-containing protein [Nitrospira lenta]SPP63567.1 Sensory response regulator with diguanylate cyclase domain [Nitrospira lenta]
MNATPLALIVDDDITLRVLAREALEQAGCRVEDAATGQEALDAFQRETPDIILLDVVMPGMDGFATCAALRKLPCGASVPILIMTGLDDVKSITTAYDAGATDFVTKPWNALVLSHRVRYMLRASQAVTELLEREMSLAEAQRIARLGNWRWNLATNRFIASTETFRILGIHADPYSTTLSFEEFVSHIHEADRPAVEAGIRQAIATGAPFRQDHRVHMPTGDTRIVHHYAEVAFEQGGAATSVVGTIQDITDQKKAEAQIHFLSNYDRLTQLPNRQLFQDRVTQALAIQKRHDTNDAILLVNLDRFQRFNDTLGPKYGDAILREVAERLLHCVRQSDSVGWHEDQEPVTLSRLGGDEFTVLLTHLASAQSAAKVTQRILESLREPYHIDGRQVVVTASIGIALLRQDGDDVDTLLRNADAAVQAAQEKGRNTYQFYSQSMNVALAERLSLESDLRQALERSEFVLYYQPQVDIRRWEVVGVEALIRWQHPVRGMVSPLTFIPLAEEVGLIDQIGQWVLRTACAQQVAWRAYGLSEISIAINLSGVQFQQADLVESIRTIVRETGANPAGLELELTESTAMHDAENAVVVFQQLKAMGFSLSIDDFGTGYSSLAYLKRFPIDTIKIDRAFVKDLASESEQAAIAIAIIAMAHGLKLRVLAEGVETQPQLDILRNQGCDAIQGYFFSHPLPADLVEQLIRDLRAKATHERPAA